MMICFFFLCHARNLKGKRNYDHQHRHIKRLSIQFKVYHALSTIMALATSSAVKDDFDNCVLLNFSKRTKWAKGEKK